MEITQNKLKLQKDFLINNINELRNPLNKESKYWNDIINYNEYCIVNNDIGLRQDQMIIYDKNSSIKGIIIISK